MKKLLALLLALSMLLSLAACGTAAPNEEPPVDEPASEEEEVVEENQTEDGSADNAFNEDTPQDAADNTDEGAPEEGEEHTEGDIPLTVDTSCRIAMITGLSGVDDGAFNQTVYEACKGFCDTNGLIFDYYQPANETTAQRVSAVELAIADGFNVIVMPGRSFVAAIVKMSGRYPDVKFVALDMTADDILRASVGESYDNNPDNWDAADYYNADNVCCVGFREELSGYMAGYAAVKMGYRHLGFLGGMTIPSVVRFGYGFIQGANDAAKELDVAGDVSVEYVYGGQFSGDADITAYMDHWYRTLGVEAVFACGGSIYTSAAEAAAKVSGKVIGVDTDQSPLIDLYGKGMTITSAMKGLGPVVEEILYDIVTGSWENRAGRIETLGLVSGEDPTQNHVGLPMETTQWNDSFTQEDYTALVEKLYSGEITVSDSTTDLPALAITLNEYGSIK